MELKQKKNQEETWSELEIQKYQKVIENSKLPLFKLITDLQNQDVKNHEPFYIFFIEKSEYQKQVEKNMKENNGVQQQQPIQQKSISNYEMKTRSIYKQPIRIQLLVNAIVKGSVGDKQVNKQYAFSKLFNTMKNNHIMQFIGEGFFEQYYISIYKCSVTDEILDHLQRKMVYVCKDSETVLMFKNESLNIKYDSFQDFFLPHDENFKYYSVSDYLKKATYKLYEKSLYFLENHDNNAFSKNKNLNISKQNLKYYQNIFTDLNLGILPDPQEKAEYDRKLAENPRYKLEVCHYYQTNSCIHKMNSVKCKFAHGDIELRESINNSNSISNYNSDSEHSSQHNGSSNLNGNQQQQKQQKIISNSNNNKYSSQDNLSSQENSQNGKQYIKKPQQIQQQQYSVKDQQQYSKNQQQIQSEFSDDYDSDEFFQDSSDDEYLEESKQQQQNGQQLKQQQQKIGNNKIAYQVKQQSQQSTSSSTNKQSQNKEKQSDSLDDEIGSLSMFCQA